MKTIKGVIKDGKVELEAEGFTGATCVEATKAYLERLQPGSDGDTRYKSEYYQVDVVENQ